MRITTRLFVFGVVDKAIIEAILPSLETIYLQVNRSIGPRERFLSILNEVEGAGKQNWDRLIRDVGDIKDITIPNDLIQ
ncbi:MAG TPA: hypothetical protein ENI27_02045 [bacterium]|nr:hypothetical protein [bacterium]